MPRPNILIFMPDQLRADSLGCWGNPLAATPHIDALARRGTRFANAYVNHPVCSPSRVSLMTGWYPHVRGHRTLTHLVQPHEPNLLHTLKAGGYQVACAGARGDVFAPGVTEASTHFSGWLTRPAGREMGMGPQHPPGSARYHAFLHGLRPGEPGRNWLDFDEALTRTAIDWLQARPAGPWCLWMPLIFPHLPFEVEAHWAEQHPAARYRAAGPPGQGAGKPRFQAALRAVNHSTDLDADDWATIRSLYAAMISRVDDQLGRVIQTLDASGQLDDTLVVFLADHGEYGGQFGLVEKWPSGLDDGLTRNPLIVAGPGVAAGRTATTLAEMVDILPTLLEAADVPAGHTHFGRSLWPALRDPAATVRSAAFCEGGFRTADHALLESPTGEYHAKGALQHADPTLVAKATAIRTPQWTCVVRQHDRDELYDRIGDPGETTNLAGRPELQPVLQALRGQLLDWLVETSDVIPWQADPRFPPIPHGQHTPFPGGTPDHS